jgi:hypothetical protein
MQMKMGKMESLYLFLFPFSRALTARSAKHLQCMNGRHTRNKRVMKRVSNAVLARECHADVVRM